MWLQPELYGMVPLRNGVFMELQRSAVHWPNSLKQCAVVCNSLNLVNKHQAVGDQADLTAFKACEAHFVVSVRHLYAHLLCVLICQVCCIEMRHRVSFHIYFNIVSSAMQCNAMLCCRTYCDCADLCCAALCSSFISGAMQCNAGNYDSRFCALESHLTSQCRLFMQKGFTGIQHMAVCDAAGAQPGVIATGAQEQEVRPPHHINHSQAL